VQHDETHPDVDAHHRPYSGSRMLVPQTLDKKNRSGRADCFDSSQSNRIARRGTHHGIQFGATGM
jgi:hypothetical protein